jgi:hypothetical protein
MTIRERIIKAYDDSGDTESGLLVEALAECVEVLVKYIPVLAEKPLAKLEAHLGEK